MYKMDGREASSINRQTTLSGQTDKGIKKGWPKGQPLIL